MQFRGIRRRPGHALGLVLNMILVLACAMSSQAQAASIRLDDSVRALPLTSQVDVWADADLSMTLDAVLATPQRFRANGPDPVNVGFTRNASWIRMHLDSASQQQRTWMLELAYPLLHHADLYIIANGSLRETQRAGLAIPLGQTPHPSRHPVFPITLAAGESIDVLLRLERINANVRAPLTLWEPGEYARHEVRDGYWLGSMFGILGAMLLYNLFLFARLRQRFQALYLLSTGSGLATMMAITGYGRVILWPDAVRLNDDCLIAGGALVIAFGIHFGRLFVNVRQASPSLDRGLQLLAAIGFVIAAVQISGDSIRGQAVTLYNGITGPVLLISMAYCWSKGFRGAMFFIVGWSAGLLSGMIFALMMHNLIPVSFLTENGMLIGTVLESILLSLGIADHLHQQRQAHLRSLEQRNDTLLKLKEAEHQLMHRALHSGTTGLPNRTLLRESIRQEAGNGGHDARFSVVLVNFRNFHEFNKTLGHQSGDEILKILSARLSEHIRQHADTLALDASASERACVATVEGVTFGCLLKNASGDEALGFGLDLVRVMETPFTFQEMSLNLHVGVGISQFPFHGDTPEQLLRNAQIALELAAEDVRQVRLYDADEDPYSAKRLTLLADLRNAINDDALDLYLQPQLDLASQRVCGAEVLIRWNHPKHGFVAPDQFIPIAERTGVIQPLTQWVFRRAFRYLEQLNQRGHHLTLSVNISARNLQDPSFQERALVTAREFRISPSQIVMEVTETAILLNEERGNNTLFQLDSAGFGIAIDDFGTGYSSLSHLKRVPVQEIKIDRSFIRDMQARTDDQVIVATTLQMGHNLGLRVVAEGIEDAGTLEFLRKAGCDIAQGYHIAKPMPFEAFLDWMEARRTAEASRA